MCKVMCVTKRRVERKQNARSTTVGNQKGTNNDAETSPATQASVHSDTIQVFCPCVSLCNLCRRPGTETVHFLLVLISE